MIKFLCKILRGCDYRNVLEGRTFFGTHWDGFIIWECIRCGDEYEERFYGD